MRIHVFQHVAFEDPGTIRLWAEAKGHACPQPAWTPTKAAAPRRLRPPVVLGGPMNIHEEEAHPWLAAEKAAVRAAVDAGKGVLGICLGAQLLSHILGGEVTQNEHVEIGWQPVTLTPQGAAHPLFAGFPETFTAFHWHGDTFSIPAGAIHAASSPGCANQAFVLGDRVAGLQFHLETAPANLVSLVKHCASEIVPGPYVQGPRPCTTAGRPSRRSRNSCTASWTPWKPRSTRKAETMRKADREITSIRGIEDILASQRVCRLGMISEGRAYVVPVNFGYEPGALYIHSSRKGKKAEALARNPEVCFEVDTDVAVVSGELPCSTPPTNRSVIGLGPGRVPHPTPRKLHGLRVILRAHGGPETGLRARGAAGHGRIRIDIESLTENPDPAPQPPGIEASGGQGRNFLKSFSPGPSSKIFIGFASFPDRRRSCPTSPTPAARCTVRKAHRT
jgi:GMP synthase-like glutamine amidotransferase/nitroimidazol reductase NimA-like FMN-containing flavoprotein (pyridoxamine 5'-phosphate oxidase superfamily)